MDIVQRFFNDHIFRFRLVFLGCAGLLGVGFVLQYAVGLIPCPLCILQRFFFALVGITAAIAAIRKPEDKAVKIYSGFMFVFSILGGALAARQIWLQHNPPSLLGSNCVPFLGSFTEVIRSTFQATADCAERGWTLLNLTIPDWSLISFIILAIISTIPFWKKEH